MNFTKTLIISVIVTVTFGILLTSNIAIVKYSVTENTQVESFLFENYTENDNFEDDITEIEKVSAPNAVTEVLGWELGDQQSNIGVPYISGGITAVCVGLAENVAVLVETVSLSEFPESRGNSIADMFQRLVYDPTEAVYGIPRESQIFPGSHDLVLVLIDELYHTEWSGIGGVYGGQYNGYEQISARVDIDWRTVTHEYQHCIYNHVSDYNRERWFNEGMAEFWPNYLGIQTTNRCADHFMEEVEDSQNIPLLEWSRNLGAGQESGSYGISFMFVFYVYEHFGIDFIRTLIEETNMTFYEAINHHLPLYGYPDMDFRDVFFNFEIANRLNEQSIDPMWGYKYTNFFIQYDTKVYASDLPVIDHQFNTHHWAAENHEVGLSNPAFAALKYTFNGSSSGDFDAHVIGSSYYNSSNIKKVVSQMTIDPVTQDGELIFILPEKVSNVYFLVANANGPEEGIDISDQELKNSLRDSSTLSIETFDPGLVGTINTLDYADRAFTVTADVNWDLETTLVENDLAPHVVLYDADGEFAFNLQGYLSYNAASDSWNGTLQLTEDIKSGDYVIKLFVRGVELDTLEGKVTGSSAPGFLFVQIFFTTIFAVLWKKRKN